MTSCCTPLKTQVGIPSTSSYTHDWRDVIRKTKEADSSNINVIIQLLQLSPVTNTSVSILVGPDKVKCLIPIDPADIRMILQLRQIFLGNRCVDDAGQSSKVVMDCVARRQDGVATALILVLDVGDCNLRLLKGPLIFSHFFCRRCCLRRCRRCRGGGEWR